MADSANSIPAPNENPITFDHAEWLSQFEAVGGGFLATESQTSLCIACQGNTSENQSAAHAMLRDLTDDQRAAVIAHIRDRAGLPNMKPDLKTVCAQGLSERAGTSAASSGSALDAQQEGSRNMDMHHSFVLPAGSGLALDWDRAVAHVKHTESQLIAATHKADADETESLREAAHQAADAYHEAHRKLLELPAPDISAVITKLEISDTDDYFDLSVQPILADLRRLGKESDPSLLVGPNAVAVETGDLTSILVDYLAKHHAVLPLAEAKQVFGATFRQREAAGAAHTEWEEAKPESWDFDHPVERAWSDALRAHEASWKLLAGSAVKTMAELEEKIDMCRADPDIEGEGFRDFLLTCIQSDIRHLAERKAA